MGEKQVFVESYHMSAPEHILIICGIVFLWFGNSFLPQPLSFNLFLGIFGGAYAMTVVAGFLQTKLTITCDSVGCDVNTRIFLQRVGKNYSFKWSEITETKFKRFSLSATVSPMFFCVVTHGEARRLLRRYWFTADRMDNFVALVNQSTPHLPYVWVKDETTLEVIEKVGRFRKVLRVNVGGQH